MKLEPTEEQKTILNLIKDGSGDIRINAYAGTGKCLGKNTPILMFNGDIKLSQNIEVGDLLMGPDSFPRKVLSTCTGRETLYKVIPVKGDSWVCNESHILSLKGTNNNQKNKIIDISIKDFLEDTEDLYKKSGRRDKNWKLYRTGVNFPVTNDLVLDPYYVGLYLGDGTRGKAIVHSIDKEIQDYLLSIGEKYKITARLYSPEKKCPYVRFGDKKNLGYSGTNIFYQFSKIFKKEKFIPVEYLRSSRENRLKLLAGLIDSDGNLSSNSSFEITTKYTRLRDNILYLCRSLGFAAYSSEKLIQLKEWKLPRTYFRINISGEISEVPTILERKKAKKRKQVKDVLKTGFSLENIGIGDYYGFEIDGDHRFLLGDFTVTHNTSSLQMIVEDNPDKKFLYLAFNKTVQKEAEKKFPKNCEVRTVHSLAFKNLVTEKIGTAVFMKKLEVQWKLKDYINHFSMNDLKPFYKSSGDFYYLCNDIKNLVRKFKNSDSNQITLDMLNFGEFKEIKKNDPIKEMIISKANEIWQAEIDMDSEVPADHGTYLKMWELTDPIIEGYDILLFDEAQDANPVMLSVVDKLENIRKVYVGDKFQSIYSWTGAVNAMALVSVDHDCYLTKSWRFGDQVANEGNRVLDVLDPDHKPLKGNSNVPSEINSIDTNKQYTVIFRTNGALAKFAIEKIKEGKTVYVEGGVKDLCQDLLALYSLKKNKKLFVKSRYMPFSNIAEVMEESKIDVGIKRDLAFIESFSDNTPVVLDNLKKEVKNKRQLKKVDIICTTAHKSKGLEFDQVVMWNDYKIIEKFLEMQKNKNNKDNDFNFYSNSSREEINLLYVLVTRAKERLQLDPGYDEFMDMVKKLGMNYA